MRESNPAEPIARGRSWNAPVRDKTGHHARQPCHWVVTHNRRNHRVSTPYLAGLALSPARAGDFKQALWMGATGHDVAVFIVSSIKRHLERLKTTEDFHVAVGNPTFRQRHNDLV
jgi:hypothetical protein